MGGSTEAARCAGLSGELLLSCNACCLQQCLTCVAALVLYGWLCQGGSNAFLG